MAYAAQVSLSGQVCKPCSCTRQSCRPVPFLPASVATLHRRQAPVRRGMGSSWSRSGGAEVVQKCTLIRAAVADTSSASTTFVVSTHSGRTIASTMSSLLLMRVYHDNMILCRTQVLRLIVTVLSACHTASKAGTSGNGKITKSTICKQVGQQYVVAK